MGLNVQTQSFHCIIEIVLLVFLISLDNLHLEMQMNIKMHFEGTNVYVFIYIHS